MRAKIRNLSRSLWIFASEDVGLAGNGALSLAVATFQAVERVGLPEASYNLYHCAIALARSAKSREVTDPDVCGKRPRKASCRRSGAAPYPQCTDKAHERPRLQQGV